MKPKQKAIAILAATIIAATIIAVLVLRTIQPLETPNNTILLIPWLKPLGETRGAISIEIASIKPVKTIIAELGGRTELEITLSIKLEGKGAIEAKNCLKELALGRSPETPIILEARVLENNCNKTMIIKSGEQKTITVELQLKLPKTPAVNKKTILHLPLELEISKGSRVEALLEPSGSISIGGSSGAGLRLTLQEINVKIKPRGGEATTITPTLVQAETKTITATSP